MAETLEDAGHLLTTRVGAPFIVNSGNLAGRVRVFNDFDFHLMIGHGSRPTSGMRLAYFRLSGQLEHQTQVSVFASNSLAIKIFQQRDGIFSRQASHLFEACNVECLAAQGADPVP